MTVFKRINVSSAEIKIRQTVLKNERQLICECLQEEQSHSFSEEEIR